MRVRLFSCLIVEDTSMAFRKVTYQEYLDWMKLEPRTSKWGAFVAYERDKCNQLLLQEYIEKFDSDSFLPPISDGYLTGEHTWDYKQDYITDAPRLSFENRYNDENAITSEVNMRMAMVGGIEAEYTDAGGTTRMTLMNSIDPLGHPELHADNMMLTDIKGQVGRAGAVVLDLGKEEAQRDFWELTGSRIQHQRRKAGEFFKRKFRATEPARRTFKLGELAYTEQDFMKPSVFKIRTVMEEGAQNRNATNYGNGAVELRIAMKDELEGGWPGEDWLYPIPSDLPGVDACMIFSNKFFMHQIIGKGTARAFNVPDAIFEETLNNKGFVESIQATSDNRGYLKLPEQELVVDSHRLLLAEYQLPMYINLNNKLSMTLYDGNRLRVGMGGVNTHKNAKCKVDGSDYAFLMALGMDADYKLTVDEEARKLIVELADFNVRVDVMLTDEMPSAVANYLTGDVFSTVMENVLLNAAKAIFNGLSAIDVFVINSLLFSSEDAVNIKTLDLTGDLLHFGSISPRLTTFAIDPMETLLGYGDTKTFKTSPVTAGVKWSVKNLDGSSVGAGQINETTGQYTAPSLDDMGGTFKRIKVTATGPVGSDGKSHVSKALVSVVAQAITLNPLVQSCPASGTTDQTRQLSANTLDGTLRWSVIGEGTIAETANPDRTNTYTAPHKDNVGTAERTFIVDEVKVTNTTTQQTQSSMIVVTDGTQTVSITVQLEGPGKANFSAIFNNKPAPNSVWACLPATGAGSIDEQSGVYTADPNSSHQFVIITVSSTLPEYDLFLGDNFYIQPLPLREFPPKPEPEEPQALIEDEMGPLQI
jgi:hypothetical protein